MFWNCCWPVVTGEQSEPSVVLNVPPVWYVGFGPRRAYALRANIKLEFKGQAHCL